MKPLPVLISTALLVLSGTAALAADAVGVRHLAAPAPERSAPLDVLVWYPAGPGGTTTRVGENPLFVGIPAQENAPPIPGRFPLVLISHGSGAHAANLAWIASRLAQEGFMVAAPNHPGTTSGDSHPRLLLNVWERTADISAVLTAMTTDPAWNERVDANKVGVLGFSLGGHTALALAGVRADVAAYARYCDGDQTGKIDCIWLSKGGVDVSKLDAERFGRSNRDLRVKAVVAVDPGLVHAMTAESLSGVAVPVHIVNLGSPGSITLAVAAGSVARAIPGARYETVPDAFHLSFLGQCKPNAPEVLKAEGEDAPLCKDGGGRPRAALHAEMGDMIAAALKRMLTPAR